MKNIIKIKYMLSLLRLWFSIAVSFCLLIVLEISIVWAGCPAPYVDPQQSGSGYAAWCACQGGTVYNDSRGYGCDAPGGGGSSGSGSANFAQELSNILLNAAENTNRVVTEGARASRDGAAQVNSAANRAAQSVELQRQNTARAESERKTSEAQKLSMELEGLPESASLAPLPEKQDSVKKEGKPQVPCQSGNVSDQAVKQYTCHTLTCGGSSMNSVCCPDGYPYLNHCDCLCYSSNEEFDCSSYSGCQYEYSID